MIRILLVDDHHIFRDGIKALINDIDGYKVVAEAADGVEALDILKHSDPELVLTDVQMPEMNGIELSRKIRQQHPEIKIIVLSMILDEQIVDQIKDTGVNAYMTKTVDKQTLIKILESVQSGTDDFLSVGIEEGNGSLKSKEAGVISTITKREMEILALIARGLTDKEIAKEVFLSPSTVITHRKNLLSKLECSNKVELTRFAMENGLA